MNRATDVVALLATAGLVAGGCSSADGGGPRSTVRDSAGITIVENALPDRARLPWRVAPEPVLEIGAAEGPEPYQLYQVRAVTRLSDGAIAVVNGGTEELRVFAADGSFSGAVGGEGDGPGEFRSVGLAGTLPGDSLLLFDSRHRRFTIVAPGPALAASFTVGSQVGESSIVALGVLADGRIVVNGPITVGEAASDAIFQRPRPLMILDSGAGLQATLDTFPTRPTYLEIGDGFSFTLVPFTVTPTFAVAHRSVHVGTGEAYEVRTYDAITGALTRLTRLDREPRPVTESDLERVIERAVDRAEPGRGPALRESYAAMPIPERMPAFRRILLDRASNLWVEDFRAHGDEPRSWTVFDPDGRVLGTVEVPDIYVHDIGDDWILGHRRDELDIPYVVLHRLERTG